MLCGRLEVAGEVDGWVGFGVSSTGQMISSASGPKNIAVVGRVDDGTVKKFALPGRYINELPQAEQTLIDTNIQVVGDSIVMSFTKLLEEDGEVEIVDGPNDFISAKGSISGGSIAGHGTNEMKDFIYKDFSEDVPTTSPSSSPSKLPTVHPTDPTTAPTSAPTSGPSMSPTDYPTTANALPCPSAGTPPVELTFGPQRFELAPPNTFCGIFIRKADGSLVPFARSYNGHPWEASPGPFASPPSGVTCTVNDCQVFLAPLEISTDRYAVLSKARAEPPREELIASFLERTTFGGTKSEIESLASSPWTATEQAAWIRTQIDLPMTSHREYYRKRTNSVWDTPAMPAKSDHPCSPNSLWRRYAFVEQDRLEAYSGDYNSMTFEVVSEEAGNVAQIYEVSDSTDSFTSYPGRGGIEDCSTARVCSNGQRFDYERVGDYIEWTVTVAAGGMHPISFRYAHASDWTEGHAALKLSVNNVTVDETYDFLYTASWDYYVYSALVDVSLNEGTNTIRLTRTAYINTNWNIGPVISKLHILVGCFKF